METLDAKRSKLEEHEAAPSPEDEGLSASLTEEIVADEQKIQRLTDTIKKLKVSAETARSLKREFNNYDKKLAHTQKTLMERLKRATMTGDILALGAYLEARLREHKEREDEYLEAQFNVDDLREDLEARYWGGSGADGQDDEDDENQGIF